jgi:Zn finger protein HypA/HybF involved in hydrogenase expression
MAAEVFAGISALKTAFDLAKGLKDIDDAARRNAAVIDLQEKILAAQAAQAALVEKVSNLEKEVASFETWETEKKRYELKDLKKGFFAYILRQDMEAGEPPHALCTNCYSRGFKSILHLNEPRDLRDRTWDCPACKTSVRNQAGDIGGLISKVRETDSSAAVSAPVAKRKPIGEVCPKCGEPEFRLERSIPHPTFGDLGANNHHMKCDCGFAEVRLITPR